MVEMCVVLYLALCCFSYCISLIFIYRRARRRRGLGSLRAGSGSVRALLVTAHPDDECMFFAPAVLQLVQSGAAVRLLCLSSGNYYNQGAQRKKELLASCAVLGIPASHVTVVENKELPDDPKAEWSTALTSMLIHKHIKTHSINMVLTFDEGGVSGHTNHIAIYRAVSHLASSRRIPEGCQVLTLRTISILRKYLSILELPISWMLSSSACCVVGAEEYRIAKEAMLCHRSQLLWFRRLYILFSRYMFINTFKAVAVETKHVKIY
ncbi:N-acetylglucosaminyl-phosphatidylinositol de-N-acetylase [Astyanax mexicanus]|uniref:N-acetylglucosaminylphosphatidylinositol deacetylase n=1 Tax=Astyanax mexicanus TaxID=7994 RepID=A0A8T2MI58_ASTMX|nr:N-acetylglucosaminyl-phosphatidylinositol de-N-acetylase [Astyanax mexicanus]KAG9281685.1 N-acetylglucosaminyl-phosphatidylinositol de-N-acetylase [Astyanax mexicanus]